MTKAELQQKVLGGEPLFVVEYRSSVPDVINYRDKTTGRAATLKTLSHNVEAGPRTITVRERVDDNFDPLAWKSPLQKGQLCVLHVEGFARENGVYKASGKLEVLADK